MGVMSVAALHQQQDGRPLMEKLKPDEEGKKERLNIWSSIQNDKTAVAPPPPPYVHPLVRLSSRLMSQKSLEICTESLGSETGSDGFSSGDEMDSYFSSSSSSKGETEDEEEETEGEETEEEIAVERPEKKELSTVNYHCSIGRRSPVRSFPPPLTSISRRDGPCLMMKPHRRDGRLVVEAVPVPSHNYLHAERHGGRLLLSFIDTSSRSNPHAHSAIEFQQQQEEEYVEEEMVLQAEEVVEVVDRGTIVEVKVSAQPQVSGIASVKVRRSSLVINKFVVGSPLAAGEDLPEIPNNGSFSSSLQNPIPNSPSLSSPPAAPASSKRTSMATTTAAAAAVAASSISTSASTTEGFHYNYLHHQQNSRWGAQSPAAAAAAESKLLFTSKRLSREELLHDMRRCSELRRPLFIFEQPHCIATSS